MATRRKGPEPGKSLGDALQLMGACSGAVAWARDYGLTRAERRRAWAECRNGGWLAWLVDSAVDLGRDGKVAADHYYDCPCPDGCARCSRLIRAAVSSISFDRVDEAFGKAVRVREDVLRRAYDRVRETSGPLRGEAAK